MVQCGECKYWIEEDCPRFDGDTDRYGECHRNAPCPGEVNTFEWPRTEKDEGCGDGVVGK